MPPKSNNTALKIILIVVGIFVLLGVLAAAILGYGAYKLSKAVHKSANGDVSFSTPGGTFSTGNASSITEADLGMPEYPGAQRTAGSMKMKTAHASVVTATFTTTDSLAQVVDFYKEKLGDTATLTERGSSTALTVGENDADKKIVTVRQQGDLMKITMMHTSRTP